MRTRTRDDESHGSRKIINIRTSQTQNVISSSSSSSSSDFPRKNTKVSSQSNENANKNYLTASNDNTFNFDTKENYKKDIFK